jgi:hypothetical protein
MSKGRRFLAGITDLKMDAERGIWCRPALFPQPSGLLEPGQFFGIKSARLSRASLRAV